MVKLTVCRVFRSIIINELNAVPSELVLHVYYNYIGTACLSCVLYEKKKKKKLDMSEPIGALDKRHNTEPHTYWHIVLICPLYHYRTVLVNCGLVLLHV